MFITKKALELTKSLDDSMNSDNIKRYIIALENALLEVISSEENELRYGGQVYTNAESYRKIMELGPKTD